MVHVAGSEAEAVCLQPHILSLQGYAGNLTCDCSVDIRNTEGQFLLTSSYTDRDIIMYHFGVFVSF